MPWTERLGSAGSDQMDAGVHRLLPRLCSPILYYTPNISLRWQRCRPNRLIDWNASCPPVSPPRRCPRSRQTACLAAPVAWNTVDATEIVLDGGKCDRTRLDRALIRFSQSVLCGVLGIVNGHLLKIERQITSAAWRKASQKPVRCALSCRKRSSAVASVDLGVHFQAVVNACQDFLTRSPQRPRAGALERACVTLQVSADALAVTTQAHVHERTQAGAEELFTSLSSELEADVFHNAWPALLSKGSRLRSLDVLVRQRAPIAWHSLALVNAGRQRRAPRGSPQLDAEPQAQEIRRRDGCLQTA